MYVDRNKSIIPNAHAFFNDINKQAFVRNNEPWNI